MPAVYMVPGSSRASGIAPDDRLDSNPEFAPSSCAAVCSMRMDVVSFTRQLVDIESVTGNEGPVGHFLVRQLRALGYDAERMVAEGERANVFASSSREPHPAVVFSTHMDTVPPFM